MPKANAFVRHGSVLLSLLVLTIALFIHGLHGLGPAAEEENHVFTLPESVALALQKSLSLDSADWTVKGALLEKERVHKNFFPTFSTSYSYTRFGNERPLGGVSVPGLSTGTRDNYQTAFTVTQPLFTGFRLTATYQLAKLGIEVAEIAREQERLDVIFLIKEAYFNILRAEKAAIVAKQTIKSVEAHLNVARNFYEVGMTTKNQVLEAEVNLAEAIQADIAAENALLISKARFNTILRRSLDSSVEVEDILVHKPFMHDLKYCLAEAYDLRPEIRSVARRIEIAEQQILVSKSAYYPTVALESNHFFRSEQWTSYDSDLLDDNTSWDITLAMSWDFWKWGQDRDAVRKSETDLAVVQNALLEVKEGIGLEVKSNYINLRESEKRLSVASKAIEQAEENLRTTEERYRAQVGTSTEVIDATTLLATSRRNFYEALYNYNIAWFALERSMGLGRDRI